MIRPTFAQVPAEVATTDDESLIEAGDAVTGQNPVSITMNVEQAFNLGMAKLQSGQFRDAIEVFRAILSLDPTLARVRLELARTYFLNEDWAAARSEFFFVLSDDVPTPVKKTITGFLRAIEVKTGWRHTFSASLISNDGALRDLSSERTTIFFNGTPLDVTINNDDDLELGLNVLGSLEYRAPLKKLGALNGDLIGVAQVYANLSEFAGSDHDDWLIGSRPTLRLEKTDESWSLGPDVSMRYVDGELLESRAGLSLGYAIRTLDAQWVNASLSVTAVNNHLTDLRDATQYSGSLSVSQSFSGTMTLTGSLSANRYAARATFESYDSFTASVAATQDFGNGFVPTLTLTTGLTLFDEIAPTAASRRRDWLVSANLSVIKNDFFLFGLNPFVTLGIGRRFSTNDFFDFTEYDFITGLRKAF